MDWYSGRPPRNGFPFDENVFQAFHAIMGVVRGGCRTDAEATAHESVTIIEAIEARIVVNFVANFSGAVFVAVDHLVDNWLTCHACSDNFQIIGK